MENNDIHLLQKENALNKRILESLVSANEELRDKNAFFVSFLQSKWDTYSPSEKEMLEKMLSYSLSEKGKASPNDSYSTTENSKGTTERSYSFPENGNGTTEESYSSTEKGKGTTERSYSLTENSKGTTDLGRSIPETGKGTTDVWSSHITIGNATYSRDSFLAHNIKTHTNYKGRRSATEATTSLLKHIYNGGDCGYPTLRKVTHLSRGGLGKMLMRLTKKGLIVRTGLQKLALTESSLHLIRKSLGQTE